MVTLYLTATSHFEENLSPMIKAEIHDKNEELLITYDLNNCLSPVESEVERFDEILDIYLLESIVHLGKYHKKYFGSEQEIPAYGLRKYISECMPESSEGKIVPSNVPQDFWSRATNYAKKLKERALSEGVWDHYQTVELPFSLSLFYLTQNGVQLDLSSIAEIQEKMKGARQKIYRALEVNNVGGAEISDLNSWIRGYGFDNFFPVGRDQISFKDLSLLEDQHQVFKIFSRLYKLKRIKSILDSIGEQRKISPFYRTMGAVTGRCTSTMPNIMGIPKVFRPVIVPSEKDFGIVECDYSQMEVGVAAALSDDSNLIDDFNNTDVYEKTGELLFGKREHSSRSKAKLIFLAIQYGMSPKTLSKLLNMTQKETSRVLEQLYSKYGGLRSYLDRLQRIGTDKGYSQSVSGLKRYRRYPERKPTYWEMNWFKNFPVQSSAASIFKRAIIKLHEQLGNEPFHLLIPLYDSIVFEAPLSRLSWFSEIVAQCMITSMTEYFPKLKPKVSVNDADPSCWNSEEKSNSIEAFLDEPLFGIDIREKPSSNVDWSEYL